jgi:3-phenylpropionate/trans-cinnamate dioxygenase ferredoxin reductase subunit
MAAAGTVIIGAGQGGFQLAASLREHGYAAPIALIGDEGLLPYQRPPLSKAYLLGEMDAERLLLRPQAFYATRSIELILNDHATGIDRPGARVMLASGRMLAYDHLVLALGARNRKLPVGGSTLDGVFYLRTRAEADAIHRRLLQAQSIVVVGAGFIGLELAAVASKLGKRVTVVEALGRAMSRAVTPPLSDFYAQAHAGWGVELMLNARLQTIEGEGGSVSGLVLADGRRLAAELVLVGIGIEPNVELAAAAGLATANGVVVDRRLATADPRISAIGDCAAFPDPTSGTRIRLESVQNAVDQARCVAKRIAGEAEDYAAVPWFWSDQRDLKLQMVGLTAGCDETVLRGDPQKRAFSVFCFRAGKLVGIESVNRAADHMFGRRLLAAGESITPEQAADASFDLKARLAGMAEPTQRTP